MTGDLRAKLKDELDRYCNRDFLTAVKDRVFNIAKKYEVERIIDTTDMLRKGHTKKVVGIFGDYVYAIHYEDHELFQKVLNNKIGRFAMYYTGSCKLMRAIYLVMAVDGKIIEDELAEFNSIALLLELHPETFGATKDRLV